MRNSHSNKQVRVFGIAALVALTLTLALTLAQDSQTTMTDEEKLQDAMSAGPATITQDATIMDWPSSEGEDFRVLREGSNGWVCLPSSPGKVAQGLRNAECDDEVWQAWLAAYLAGEVPQVDRFGITYSLSYTASGSNTDPSATGPTDDNGWHTYPPHIAVLLPNLNYEGISTDPHNGGPYVMFPGTPYAHIMVPVAPHMME